MLQGSKRGQQPVSDSCADVVSVAEVTDIRSALCTAHATLELELSAENKQDWTLVFLRT